MIVTRHHDFCAAHRIVGHPGKCRHLHGHNYRVYLSCEGDVKGLGMVIDFGIMKASLCQWIDITWDHKTILWDEDPIVGDFGKMIENHTTIGGLATVPFNPTAENMAEYLLNVVGPMVLPPDIKLVEVVVEETRKCSATARI